MSDAMKEIVLRAWTDPDFKNRLLKEPASVLDEFDVSYDGKEIRVIENSESTVYFVLPETPDFSSMSEKDIGKLADSILDAQLVLPTILSTR